ncbi:hypothetical protein PCANC_03792 [Puccinia coronata f. sp. avenae]|uniref:SAC domain-containing protein n=1 Tax=Puccinia coronata f. sp. avenae TaxID=200324 RepID=A0A2N5UZB9_9BASI|nr:hypothetical protein PCASD_06073 [Puccinia coronata f. sp. avenae]PLW53928.1 hypothetical protein PCANC_03792 [Puccinia coronata f. sp. avenae]
MIFTRPTTSTLFPVDHSQMPATNHPTHRPAISLGPSHQTGPMERFCLYETRGRFYITGSDQPGLTHRVLKIDKNLDDDGQLMITEDATVYTSSELKALIEQLSLGNATAGGLTRPIEPFWGIVGFIKFTGPYYLVTIKTRIPVAMVGGHYIYHSEETQLTPVTGKVAKNQQVEEARLMAAFKSVDLSKNFYFSYSYDITNTLQSYFIHTTSHSASLSAFPRDFTGPVPLDNPVELKGLDRRRVAWGFHDKFFWNYYLLSSAFGSSIDKEGGSPWVLPLIYGFVDQSKLNVFGRTVYVAVIARRSRHFAGARFLKRGVSEDGYVANEVEIEQIVTDAITTALHLPDPANRDDFDARKPNPRYTSYVQLRGSIPLLWNQDTTITKAKPPIEFSVIDPYFSGAAIHFDDLFARYGTPVIVLNLIKEKERQTRESKLLPEFRQCLKYLSQFLPEPASLEFSSFDMSAAQRSRQVDVISYLSGVAEEVIEKTKFFHSGPDPNYKLFQSEEAVFNDDGEPEESGETQKSAYRPAPLLQCGVCRTNCIDCIDRTNAAQFVVGKAALAHQLHALGIIKSKVAPYDSDAVDILTNMYHDLGDTIALQYGGSHLVNTLQTYRKTGNQYKSHARDTLEGLKRFYANSFADADKQASINLFLGITESTPSMNTAAVSTHISSARLDLGPGCSSIMTSLAASTIDSLESDNESEQFIPFERINPAKRSYSQWFHPDHLIKPPKDPETITQHLAIVSRTRGNDDYFLRYYRPWLWTSTENHLGRRMNSSDMFIPKGLSTMVYTSSKAMEMNLSPFKRRRGVNELVERLPRHSAERTPHGVGVSVGVRRWLKTKSNLTLKSNLGTIKGISSSKGRSKSQLAGTRDTRILKTAPHRETALGLSLNDDQASSVAGVTGNETRRLATKLLEPTVEVEESREYHSYLHQFDKLKLYSTSARNDIYEADLKIYEKSAALSSSDPSEGYHLTSAIQVEEKNRLLYEEAFMVATMSPLD